MEILTITPPTRRVHLMRCFVGRALAAALLLTLPLVSLAEESLEYGVKAAFLYKFGFYVEWPAAAFISPTSPMHICILGGDDRFVSTMEKVVGTEQVNGRTVVVRRVKTAERDSGCHILYIGATEVQHVAQDIETVRGTNMLTVTDGGGVKSGAGIIDFVIVNNRVRFDIDDEAAAKNGLTISSKLMSLALNVKRRNN